MSDSRSFTGARIKDCSAIYTDSHFFCNSESLVPNSVKNLEDRILIRIIYRFRLAISCWTSCQPYVTRVLPPTRKAPAWSHSIGIACTPGRASIRACQVTIIRKKRPRPMAILAVIKWRWRCFMSEYWQYTIIPTVDKKMAWSYCLQVVNLLRRQPWDIRGQK